MSYIYIYFMAGYNISDKSSSKPGLTSSWYGWTGKCVWSNQPHSVIPVRIWKCLNDLALSIQEKKALRLFVVCLGGGGLRDLEPVPNFQTHMYQYLYSKPRKELKRKIRVKSGRFSFFPRASQRRVLLIVEVCHHILSSQLLVFTSSYIFLHLLIFTPTHLHIFSSHLLIFTPSHLHTFASSHLLTFTSSHLHIFSLLLSLPLALFSLLLFYFSLKGRGSANEASRNATFSHETRLHRQKLQVKLQLSNFQRKPFARNEVPSLKIAIKFRFSKVRRNPSARNEVPSSKTVSKIPIFKGPAQPFRTKSGSIVK